MKRLLLIGATLCLWHTTMQAQTRLSLYEEFTGETCGSCASANPSLDALMETTTNLTKTHMIKYMCDIPSSGPLYFMTNVLFESDRQTYYNVPFAPFGTFDGQIPTSSAATSYPGFSAYVNQADIDQYAAVTAPFNIAATYYYNAAHDSITINVNVTATAAYAPTGGIIKLRSALCKSLHFVSPVSNGEQDIPNVVRNMYPSAAGTAMAATWAVGATQSYTLKGAVISEVEATVPHSATDSTVVVWIQDDNDKKIAQTAMASKIALSVGNGTSIAPAITIYPNPAADDLTLAINTGISTKMAATIIDGAGRVLVTLPQEQLTIGSNTINIDTKALASGTYFLRIQTGENTTTKTFSIAK